MAKQTVNIGSFVGDPTADITRDAFDKINDNFNELYASFTYDISQSQLSEHNRSFILMRGNSLTYTLVNSLSIETGVPFYVIQNGTGFTIDSTAINANIPQALQDISGSIYVITKTGTTTGTDNYTILQIGVDIGVSDHGALTGLADDDHPQYLTETRHDALPSDNPHGVTANQVGLGNVDNTSDLDKPVSTAQQTALDAKQNRYHYNVLDYSANGDGIQHRDGAITATDNTLTSATAIFTANDVGKVIHIKGAGASGGFLTTTISSFTSATEVEITDAAATTVSGATFIYGTDNTTPIQNAINACFNGGGGEVFFPNGIYIINGALQNNIGAGSVDYNSQLYIPRQSETEENLVTVSIKGETQPYVVGGTGIDTIESPQLTGAVLLSTIQGSGAKPSVLCSTGLNSGTFFDLMNNAQTYIENLSVLVTPDANNKVTMGGINMYRSIVTGIEKVVCFPYDLDLFDSEEPNVIDVTGVSFSAINSTKQSYLKNINVGGFTNGFEVGEHGIVENIAANCCVNGVLCNGNNHTTTIVKVNVDWCRYGISAGSSTARINVLDFMGEHRVGSKWYDTLAHVYDPNDYLSGQFSYNIVEAGVGFDNSLFVIDGGANLLTKPISYNSISEVTVTGNTDTEKLNNLISVLVNAGLIKSSVGLSTIHEYPLNADSNDVVGSLNGTDTDITYVGNEAEFNGTTSFISLGDDDSLSFVDGGGDIPFEIEFDVTFDTVASCFLINKRASGSAFEYQINYTGSALTFTIYVNTASAFMTRSYAWTPTAATKYNIKANYDGSGVDTGLTLSIDDVSGGTASTTGTYTGMSNTTAPFIIGRRSSPDDLFLDGKIDNLKIKI